MKTSIESPLRDERKGGWNYLKVQEVLLERLTGWNGSCVLYR